MIIMSNYIYLYRLDALRHIMKMQAILLAIVICMPISSAIASEKILINDKFDDPYKPKFITVFGNPKFVKPAGDSITNSLELSCSPLIDRSHRIEFVPFDQIDYPVDNVLSEFKGLGKVHYKVQFDLITHGLVGSKSYFSVDVGGVVIQFNSKGKVEFGSLNEDSYFIYKYVDDYTDNTLIRAYFDIDLINGKIIVYLNMKKIFDGAIKFDSLSRLFFSQQKIEGCTNETYTNLYNLLVKVVEDDNNKMQLGD